MTDPRIRRDVGRLAIWDPALIWYAKAVAQMQTRPLDDPTSWRYLAAIHRYRRDEDVLQTPSDKLPSDSDQRRFWTQCQHNSWFFLPWHRMYLAVFEQIVASTIAELGGPHDWTLPYWNYSDGANANARVLPRAFYSAQLPDGSPNPLLVVDRNSGWNQGVSRADDQDVDVNRCLKAAVFSGSAVSASFGGGPTVFNHEGGVAGLVDAVPHGSMHMALGGWMRRFSSAALDPIFWLHHANIDRLWTIWLKRDTQHSNPAERNWLTALRFEFHDGARKVVAFTPSQMVDTMAMPAPYKYEDETDPVGGIPVVSGRPKPGRRARMTQRRIPEMIAATSKPILLAGDKTSTTLSATAPSGPGRRSLERGTAGMQIFLNIENITGVSDATSYSVYLDLPADANPAEHPELMAGLLPMFGVTEASQLDESHPGSGLSYSMEITEIVRTLEARKAWDPGDIRLTFVPKQRAAEPAPRGGTALPSPIKVGRVSLYFD